MKILSLHSTHRQSSDSLQKPLFFFFCSGNCLQFTECFICSLFRFYFLMEPMIFYKFMWFTSQVLETTEIFQWAMPRAQLTQFCGKYSFHQFPNSSPMHWIFSAMCVLQSIKLRVKSFHYILCFYWNTFLLVFLDGMTCPWLC